MKLFVPLKLNIQSRGLFIFLLVILSAACGQQPMEDMDLSQAPLQRESNLALTSPPTQVPVTQVSDDWSRPKVISSDESGPAGATNLDGWKDQNKALVSKPQSGKSLKLFPDHSFNTIWVNIFPVVPFKTASTDFMKRMPAPDPYGVTRDLSSLRLESDAPFKVVNLDTGMAIAQGRILTFSLAQKTFSLDGRGYPLQNLYVVAGAGGTTDLYWDRHTVPFTYKGNFVITREALPGGRPCLRVVNVVDFDNYLAGVVPSEMPADFPAEALKSQAVAARTYALNKMLYARCDSEPQQGKCLKTKAAPFDVYANTSDQMYLGVAKENGRTNLAVKATTGLVVTYHGQVIQALFHDNSGGRTCSYHDCYGAARIPYLVSVPELDPKAVRALPGGLNEKLVSGAMLARSLRARGIKFKDAVVTDFEPYVRNASDRTVEAVAKGPTGSVVVPEKILNGLRHEFRITTSYLGMSLKGQKPGVIKVRSFGFGHGVGLSQVGARVQANLGKTFRSILEYYYHNTQVVDLRH